jgi:hypothetical protein
MTGPSRDSQKNVDTSSLCLEKLKTRVSNAEFTGILSLRFAGHPSPINHGYSYQREPAGETWCLRMLALKIGHSNPSACTRVGLRRKKGAADCRGPAMSFIVFSCG